MLPEIPEELVIDASILFSFFKANSSRRDVFKKLLEHESKLASPDFALKELSNNKPGIIKFANINKGEFDDILSELNRDLETLKSERYEAFLPEANRISPHGEDTKDDPYFALALALNCAIWSDEAAFKQQSLIKVLNTKELLELLKKSNKSIEDKS